MPDAPKTVDQIPQRQHNEDRLRRADSWLRRSEEAEADTAEKFIFLWIAFNAAYGHKTIPSDFDPRPNEHAKFEGFLKEILDRDHDKALEKILWTTYPGPIRVLLKNRYVFEPFWDAVRDSPTGRDWKKNFQRSYEDAQHSLVQRDVHHVLRTVFDRLYTLRNQIVHGGATFKDGWGQDQVRDGSRIMASLVPAILDIMRAAIKKNRDSDIWGKVSYPRINDAPQ